MKPSSPLRRLTHALPVALGSLILLSAGMCRQAEEPPQAGPAPATAAEELAEAAAAERAALEAERVRLEAEAQAAAEAERQRLAELAEAESELAEREARLAAEREELRRRQALEAERQRLAEREAAAAARERELAEREAELHQREAETAAAGPLPAETAEAEPWNEPWRERRLDEAEAGPSAAAEPPVEAEPAPALATLEPGKVIEIEVLETLTSRTSQVGDTFSARLVADLRNSAGVLVVPAGAEILGRVTEVTPLKRIGGRATLGVEFTHVVVSPEQTVAINASFVEFGADKRRDKRKIAAGAIVGAILGHVLGGDGSGNVIAGAAAGAAAGTAVVASGKDKDAEIPAGSIIALQLEEVVTVEIEYGPVAER